MSVFIFIYHGQDTNLKHALVYQDQSGLSGLTCYPMESMRFCLPYMHFMEQASYEAEEPKKNKTWHIPLFRVVSLQYNTLQVQS